VTVCIVVFNDLEEGPRRNSGLYQKGAIRRDAMQGRVGLERQKNKSVDERKVSAIRKCLEMRSSSGEATNATGSL